jgi:hypothetical protein
MSGSCLLSTPHPDGGLERYDKIKKHDVELIKQAGANRRCNDCRRSRRESDVIFDDMSDPVARRRSSQCFAMRQIAAKFAWGEGRSGGFCRAVHGCKPAIDSGKSDRCDVLLDALTPIGTAVEIDVEARMGRIQQESSPQSPCCKPMAGRALRQRCYRTRRKVSK